MDTLKLILINVIHVFIHLATSTLIKSVDLTPTNPSQNGAIINLINTYNSDTFIQNNQWVIDSTSTRGYNIEINLDSSWGFHSILDSSIKLTMYSSTPIGNSMSDTTTDLDLIASFSVNNNQYVTSYMRLDLPHRGGSNKYYPACSASPGTNTLGSGDVKSCVDSAVGDDSCIPNSQCTGLDRHCKSIAGAYQPDIEYKPSNPHSLPLIFDIGNYPSLNQARVKLSNPQWEVIGYSQDCYYSESWSVESGLSIYLAVDDADEYMTFDRFKIEYYHNQISPQYGTWFNNEGVEYNFFPNEGKVTGIASWGLFESTGYYTWEAMGNFVWITEGNIQSSPPMGANNAGINYIGCSGFTLDSDDYINGYKVRYATSYFIYGITFYTFKYNEYSCVASGGVYSANIIDTDIVRYNDSYLSGFLFDEAWVIDGIQFIFTPNPTSSPTLIPTQPPSSDPSGAPSSNPSETPTTNPTSKSPTNTPSQSPSLPSQSPSKEPSNDPTESPSADPSDSPTAAPTSAIPTQSPSKTPSISPTLNPSLSPSSIPSKAPSYANDGAVGDRETTTHPARTEDGLNAPTGNGTEAYWNYIIIFCAVIMCLICVICILAIILIKKKRKAADKNVVNVTQTTANGENENDDTIVENYNTNHVQMAKITMGSATEDIVTVDGRLDTLETPPEIIMDESNEAPSDSESEDNVLYGDNAVTRTDDGNGHQKRNIQRHLENTHKHKQEETFGDEMYINTEQMTIDANTKGQFETVGNDME